MNSFKIRKFIGDFKFRYFMTLSNIAMDKAEKNYRNGNETKYDKYKDKEAYYVKNV